jgi:hypothetical protein
VHVVIDGRFVLDEADLQMRLGGALGYGPSYRRDLEDLRERLAAGDPRPLRLVWTHAAALMLALSIPRFDRYVEILERIELADRGRPWDDCFVFRVLD